MIGWFKKFGLAVAITFLGILIATIIHLLFAGMVYVFGHSVAVSLLILAMVLLVMLLIKDFK